MGLVLVLLTAHLTLLRETWGIGPVAWILTFPPEYRVGFFLSAVPLPLVVTFQEVRGWLRILGILVLKPGPGRAETGCRNCLGRRKGRNRRTGQKTRLSGWLCKASSEQFGPRWLG